MPLPELFLQELKLRNDLAEIASSYVHLKRSGKNLVGLCPFHNEKSPSFHIYTENNTLLFWLRCGRGCYYLCPPDRKFGLLGGGTFSCRPCRAHDA